MTQPDSTPRSNRPDGSSSCAWSGAALEHLQGNLDPARSAELLAHVEAGCAACAAELDAARALFAAVDEARFAGREVDAHAPAAAPRGPDTLRERVLDAVRGAHPAADADPIADTDRAPAPDRAPRGHHDDGVQTWRRWANGALPPGGMHTVRGDDDWEDTAIEGIRVRRLALDPEHRRATMLIRMDPGTAYPPHRHGGAEECFVLAGDLQVGDREVLHAGDFQRAEEGSVHPVQSTAGGCTLLIVSSLDDELLPVE